MHKNLFSIIALTCMFVLILSGCSTASEPKTQATRVPTERTSGYVAPDGVFVGPRGESTAEGVPVGLGAYGDRKKHKGDLTITENGSKVNNIDVDGVIYVNANDVTVSNFTAERVTQKPGKTGMNLEDGTIDGKNLKNDGVQWSNFTLRRMDISRTFDGIKAQGNVVIEDSYIHDLYSFRDKDAGAGGYSHNDCIQISTGTNILIQRNWLDNCGFNSAIFIDPDQGPIDNVTVQHNYLNGGGITLYAIASRSATNGLPTNVTISNNVFGETHQYDYATIGAGINFDQNVTIKGMTFKPRIDNDVS